MPPLSLLQMERDNPLALWVAIVPVALGFLATVGDKDAAAAFECPAMELAVPQPLLGRPTWSSRYEMNLPPITSRRGGGAEFLASPACTLAPSLSDGLIDGVVAQDQRIAPIRASGERGPRANATVNRAPTTGSRTMKTKSRIPTIKISIPPQSGNKHPLRARMTPIDIMAKTGERPSIIIGPTDQHSANQTTAINLFPAVPAAQSGRPPVGLSNLLPNAVLQLGYDESARMNVTTTQAIHGGECAYGCP